MKLGRRPCPRGHGIFRGSCPVCKSQRDQQRGGARSRGYTPEWDAYSKAYLEVHKWCRCGQRATITDHVVALADGGALMDPQNHQPLCTSCNTAKAVKGVRS